MQLRYFYREIKDKKYQQKAIDEPSEALSVGKMYAEYALMQNINPLRTNGVDYVHWLKSTGWAAQDIKNVKED